MTTFTKILILLISIQNCYSQKSFLEGKWKVIAVDTGELYVNAKTDSISSEKITIHEMDSVEKKVFIKNAGKFYLNNTFIFDENGEFIEISEYFTSRLKYVLDEKRKIIKINNNNEDGKNKEFEILFEYKNNLLYLSLKRAKSETKYTLERLE